MGNSSPHLYKIYTWDGIIYLRSPSHIVQMVIPELMIVKCFNTFDEVGWAQSFNIYTSLSFFQSC